VAATERSRPRAVALAAAMALIAFLDVALASSRPAGARTILDDGAASSRAGLTNPGPITLGIGSASSYARAAHTLAGDKAVDSSGGIRFSRPVYAFSPCRAAARPAQLPDPQAIQAGASRRRAATGVRGRYVT
jgi:hypothetical protein